MSDVSANGLFRVKLTELAASIEFGQRITETSETQD